jgi:uncharacterized protein (TIGR03437 family)
MRSAVLLTTLLCGSAWGQTYTISTIAGGPPANIPGTSLGGLYPAFVAADRAGNVFFAIQNTVMRLDAATGNLTPVAGNGTSGFSGDGGPATSAQLANPQGLAVDSAGNLYIVDTGNLRIRKISNGVITTLAGNGTQGFSGDGPATSAQFNLYNSGYPNGVAVDSAGNVYIVDSGNKRIRKISNGVISTVAGNGMTGFSGDNGPATSAELNEPEGLAADSAGNLYIADWQNNRIRMVSNGVISTVVGTGTRGFSGDGGPATSAQLAYPQSVAVDSAGNLYIADTSNSRIRKVSNGVITTVAGNGGFGFSGDNGPATSAQLNGPVCVAVDSAGNLYIADQPNQRIRKVSNGVITTVVGGGSSIGDNGPATNAQLYEPSGVAVDSAGNLYIADAYNYRIRKVSNGVITTVAGNGTQGFSGDNGPATSAQFYDPVGVAVDSAGNLYIADFANCRIRKVTNGVITTVAGNETRGFSGDGGPATNAELNLPAGVAVDSAGNLYIADSARIRKVSNGVITTIAGNGISGFSGDNGPAASAQVSDDGIAVDSAGSLYIADGSNHRIRKISNGVITTVAGDGVPGFSGDNGPATSAELMYPSGIAVDSAGSLFIADSNNNRIRKVSGGVIVTIAGNGKEGYSGDGGPATSAELYLPFDIAVDSAGRVYIADDTNGTIRVLTPASCTYSVSPTALQFPASGGSLTVNVQSAASCPWAVSGVPGWITVSTASSGAASASLSLAVGPNNTGAPLGAVIVVAGVSVTITQPAPTTVPLPPIKAVVNAASYIGGPVSPGEMVTIFGTVIGPPTAAYATVDPSTGKLATTIGGVQVLFSGIPAPMIYASSTQVSAVVPYEIASAANPSVRITYEGQTSDAYPLSVAASAPGLFSQNASGGGQGAILNQDNTLNWGGNLAAPGSIVQMFLTGEGQTNPPGVTGAITSATLPPPQVTPAPALPIQVSIGGQPAVYTYAGEAPGMVAGVMQLNVRIPANVQPGLDFVVVSIGGKMSQGGITVSVHQ